MHTSVSGSPGDGAGTFAEQRFRQALDALIERIKQDRAILAAILCGSLAHDRVWEKSDIDLVLVTIDDKLVPEAFLSLNADGVNVHAQMIPRAQFRKVAEGATRNTFAHSLLAKGKLLYSHDSSLIEVCERLGEIGKRDTGLRLLVYGMEALTCLYKAHKWLITRGDLDYAALWALYAATPIAKIEIAGRGMLVGREVIPEAMELNPGLFSLIYTDLLNKPKTSASVQAALAALDSYLCDRARELFGLLLDYLEEASEVRSCTEISDYFKRNYGVGEVTVACEYLADEGLIGKAASPVRLTKKSSVQAEELAFYSLGGPPDEF